MPTLNARWSSQIEGRAAHCSVVRPTTSHPAIRTKRARTLSRPKPKPYPITAVTPTNMPHAGAAVHATAAPGALADGPVLSEHPAVEAEPTAVGPKSGAVIVGGGPAGLAAALLLAKRGWTDITVLEQRDSFTTADADKSYVYMVDGRSRRLLEQFGLADQVPILGHLTAEINITCAHPDGKMSKKHFPIKDMSNVAHYMPRAVLLTLLAEAAQASPSIRLVSSAKVSISRQQQQVVVEAQVLAAATAGTASAAEGAALNATTGTSSSNGSSGSSSLRLRPRLLLGCDGLRSAVRAALAEWEKQDSPGSQRFSMVQMPSPSSGLRFKMLPLPPNPQMRNGERLPNNNFALIYSRHPPMRLAMLPVKDPAADRPANLICYPDNPVWDITTAEGMYDWMADHFPQMDAKALVPHDVMAHFAASRGGYFPTPQYCNALGRVLLPPGTALADTATAASASQAAAGGPAAAAAAGISFAAASDAAVAGGARTVSGAQGVLLLGDAAHGFPPDMGAGVNSALEDVDVLGRALEDAGDDVAGALQLYEKRRTDDVRALVRLVQTGGPYQYGVQAFAKALWQARFLGLMALSKVLPGLFHPPIMLMVQDSKLSFSEIMRRADATALRVKALLAALAAVVVAVALRA